MGTVCPVGHPNGAPYDGTVAVGARPLVPSRLSPGGVAHGSHRQPTSKLGGYIALAKLRVVELLLVTTVPVMVLAEQGWPSTWLVVMVLLGGTLAAGGANAINMVIDRDIDALMPRTQGRPLVTGLITVEPGYSKDAVVTAAKAAVGRYINGLGINGDLVFSELVYMVQAVPGVYDVQFTTPTANVVIGEGELARARAENINLTVA